MILALICIGLGLLLFAIDSLVKLYNWKMQGYNGTFKALIKGTLKKVDNPREMSFISIENKMYHIGAWKAYREFINLFNEGKDL